MKTLNPAVARLKRLHYPLDVILTCVRWYPTDFLWGNDRHAAQGPLFDYFIPWTTECRPA
jgi:hypothetical protein